MPTNPRTVHKLITPCSLNTIKLLTTHSRVGHMVFWALTHWQSNKSYCLLFHPKTVSVFLFGTSEWGPSFSNTYKETWLGKMEAEGDLKMSCCWPWRWRKPRATDQNSRSCKGERNGLFSRASGENMALPQFKATEIHFPLLTSGRKKINTCCGRHW